MSNENSISDVLLNVSVIDQLLTLSSGIIAEKSKNYLMAAFEFKGKWLSPLIDKILCRFGKGDTFYDIEVEDCRCMVPWEVLSESGFVTVCCYAVSGDNSVITTNSGSFRVEAGTLEGDADIASEPTPTIYSQISDKVDSLKIEVENNLGKSIEANTNAISELSTKMDTVVTNLIDNIEAEIEEIKNNRAYYADTIEGYSDGITKQAIVFGKDDIIIGIFDAAEEPSLDNMIAGSSITKEGMTFVKGDIYIGGVGVEGFIEEGITGTAEEEENE
jgi:hypothetical protein